MVFDPVYLTAWFSAGCYFVARIHPVPNQVARSLNRVGVLVLGVHILLAYWLTHAGSHAAAVEHVADRTDELTGIRSGAGLYANFATVFLWAAISFASQARTSRVRIAIEVFLWIMFLSAAIVFAKPESAVLFSALVLVTALSNLLPKWSPEADRS